MTTKTEVQPVIVGSEDKGARGHRIDSEASVADPANFHAVSKIRVDAGGRVSAVEWGQIDPQTIHFRTEEAVAPVRDVVEALHNGDTVFALFPSADGRLPERHFVAIEHADGQETIALESDGGAGLQLSDMDRIDD